MSLVPVPTQSAIFVALRSFLTAILPAGVEVVQGQEWPPSQHYVYIHAKPCGVPFYVGKGSGRRGLRVRNRNRNKFHQDIVSHYGAENIQVGMILCENEATAFELECLAIRLLRESGCRLANFNDGGEGSTNPSIDTRAKMAAAKIGRPMSLEVRMKISASLSSRPKSREHIAAVSAAHKASGIRPTAEAKAKSMAAITGSKQTDEHKRKKAEANRGKKRSPEFRALMSSLAKARLAAGTLNIGRSKK